MKENCYNNNNNNYNNNSFDVLASLKGSSNKDEIQSLINIVKNLNEIEKYDSDEEICEISNKIKISDILNSNSIDNFKHNNKSVSSYRNLTDDDKYENNFKYSIENENYCSLNNQSILSKKGEFDDDLCTFDPVKRKKYKDLDSLEDTYRPEKFEIPDKTETFRTKNESYLFEVPQNENIKDSNYNILEAQTFYSNFNNFNEKNNNKIEALIKQLSEFKKSIYKILEEVDLEIVNLIKNSTNFNFNSSIKEQNNLFSNIKNTIEKQIELYLNLIDKNPFNNEECIKNKLNDLNINFLNKKMEHLNSEYKIKIKESKIENFEKDKIILKYKETITHYEKILLNSKSLIEEFYAKNKILKQKLIKYKLNFEKLSNNLK